MHDIIAELAWRGLVHQSTDPEQLAPWLNEKPRAVYAGFDPTADSLHVGHLMALMLLRRFQRCGHRPILLIGGATGMIGDPSGKSDERNLLSLEALRHNVECIKQQVGRMIDFDASESGALLVNNYDWMQPFSFLEFLRDVGKHVPVSVMLSKDSVKARLERTESGLSYTEFSYMLLQAYDFVYLNKTYNCEMQIGGSDQWGNITAGIDLARRLRGASLHGMTCPLLTKSDGTKMGKTESGALWLDANRTSPYAFYQYWINVADDDAGRCLRFLTELPRDEIESLDASRAAEPHARASQKRLAEELTRFVHGDEGLQAARKATDFFFEIENISDQQLNEIFADVPSQTVPKSRLSDGSLNLVEAFALSKLAGSKGEARRIVEQGGAYVNNRRREGIDTVLTADDLASETIIVLRSGKKKYALLRFATET